MEQILLQWTYNTDIISVPKRIAENLNYFQMEFDQWTRDINNKHQCWRKIDLEDEDGIDPLEFGSDAFILWLNNYALTNDEFVVSYIAKNIQPSIDQKKLPIIFF